MLKINVLLTAMMAISLTGIAAEQSPHWSYDGQDGPAHWSHLAPAYSECESGKNQSPVNIHGALKTHQDELRLTFREGRQEITDNGHSIQVNVSGGNTLLLDSETFTLQQFHFHSPAENELDGKQYPLEAHFVYKDKEGDLTVLALMFQEGNENPELAKAWARMPREPGQSAVLEAPVDIRALLTAQRAYYRLSGSLTTPPCTEGVRWIVFREPLSASAEQISQFTTVMHHSNNRPVQPLDGRVIVE